MDFIEDLKDKLKANNFEEVAARIEAEHRIGATMNEKLGDVGAYLNEVLIDNQELINLIGTDVDFFNAEMKKQGVDFIKKW